MREKLESILIVLAVGSTIAIGAKRIGIPYNVALVITGLLLVFMDVLPHLAMDPVLILMVFLPVLVFEGALSADSRALRSVSRPIFALAIPGVAISLLGTAAVAMFDLDLPFSAALLLGALLAITDTVSVLLAFRSVRVPHRLAAIMEGESLFNDGTALVLVSVATSAVASGEFDLAEVARALVVAIVGGVLLGAAFGALGGAILRRAPDHLTAILASIVLVFATALISERMHASPVIAVVVLGIVIGRAVRVVLEPSRVLAMLGFWETAGFVLNVLLFLLVGMQIEARMLIEQAPSILLALIALHAGRAVAVYGCFGFLRIRSRDVVPARWQHTMVIGNVKGALSMAAVLALPESISVRPRLVTIVFGVTFMTLITQALPFGRILRWLRLGASADESLFELARAALVAARRGQIEIDDLLAAGLLSRRDHAERRAAFQRKVIRAEDVLRAHDESGHAHDHHADAAILNAQKAALIDAVQRGLIGSEVGAAEVNRLDRELFRIDLEGGH